MVVIMFDSSQCECFQKASELLSERPRAAIILWAQYIYSGKAKKWDEVKYFVEHKEQIDWYGYNIANCFQDKVLQGIFCSCCLIYILCASYFRVRSLNGAREGSKIEYFLKVY